MKNWFKKRRERKLRKWAIEKVLPAFNSNTSMYETGTEQLIKNANEIYEYINKDKIN